MKISSIDSIVAFLYLLNMNANKIIE